MTESLGPHTVRASDAEREEFAGTIREAVGEGRLSLDEGDDRLAKIYAARFREELPGLIRDLPQASRGSSGGPGRAGASGRPGPGGRGPRDWDSAGPTDDESTGRGPWDRRAWDRGSWDRGPWDRGSWRRGPWDRGPSGPGRGTGRRHARRSAAAYEPVRAATVLKTLLT